MTRQRLHDPVDEQEYLTLFRLLSPVQTTYWCAPGQPPALALRTTFNDRVYNGELRARRAIVKGRFMRGAIGYVAEQDLELFACAYHKDGVPSSDEQEMLYLFRQEGPMNIGQIKGITGLRSKDIAAVLHKLQEKFLVFEDQIDSESDRGWFLFAGEFPTVDLHRLSRAEAISHILHRFVQAHGFFTLQMARSFYGFTLKDMQNALAGLCEDGRLISIDLQGEQGYTRPEDEGLLRTPCEPITGIHVLHRSDFLVKSDEEYLKGRYKYEDFDELHYILMDGCWQGAVVGRFRNGPFDIQDVVLEDPDQGQARKAEIIAAIARVYDLEASPIYRFCGEIQW